MVVFPCIEQGRSPQVVSKKQIFLYKIVSFRLKNVVFATYLCSFGSSCDYTTPLLRLSIRIMLCIGDTHKSAICFQQQRYLNWPYVQIWVTSFCTSQTESTETCDIFNSLLAHKHSNVSQRAKQQMLKLFTEVEFDVFCYIWIAFGAHRSVLCTNPVCDENLPPKTTRITCK